MAASPAKQRGVLVEMRQARPGTARRPAHHRPRDRRAGPCGRSCRHRRRGRQVAGARSCGAWSSGPTRSACSSSACPARAIDERGAHSQDRRSSPARNPATCSAPIVVRALAAATGREVRLVGVGGRHLQALGLKSLLRCVRYRTDGRQRRAARPAAADAAHRPDRARHCRSEAPDCLITIDTPDFSLRVARKVRAAAPVHPDRPLCLSVRLGLAAGPRARPCGPMSTTSCACCPSSRPNWSGWSGPPGTFVGHRLVADPGIKAAADEPAASCAGIRPPTSRRRCSSCRVRAAAR